MTTNQQARPVLIQNARLLDPSQRLDARGDLLLHEGKIAWSSVSGGPMPVAAADCQIVSGEGLVAAPGFVDLHCHLREPGFESKETIASGTQAAAAGGFTTVCCMPNTSPAMHDRSVMELVLRIARERGVVRVLPIGAVSRDLAGKELAQMGEMAALGAVGFSDDGNPVWDAKLMRHAMEYSLSWGLPVIDHCQEPALTKDASMHEGPVSARLGLKGWPAAAENIMVARNIELCRLTGARVHIAHLSTARGVDLVRQAKAQGLPVTAEVTPHHLTLTHERVLGCDHGMGALSVLGCDPIAYDTSARVNPPLRTEDDIAALIAGLQDGAIDCIATDHAPHAQEDKLCEFDQAANGISGFETAFGALMSLVHAGLLDLNLVIEKLTVGPAAILAGSRKPEAGNGGKGRNPGSSFLVPAGLGTLSPGAPADVVLLDLDREWTVDPDAFYSKGKNTPLIGAQLKGRVAATFYGGRQVYGQSEG